MPQLYLGTKNVYHIRATLIRLHPEEVNSVASGGLSHLGTPKSKPKALSKFHRKNLHIKFLSDAVEWLGYQSQSPRLALLTIQSQIFRASNFKLQIQKDKVSLSVQSASNFNQTTFRALSRYN
jgi:hypothetical protein